MSAVVAVMLAVGLTGTAEAHFLGYDSVDGCEIRWEDETSWETERQAAQSAWEALKGGDNCVDLGPDAWNTNADLEWKDANRSDVTWAGLYESEFSADDIHLNSFYLSSYGSCMRRNVAMHELGHAHGLDHSSNSSSGNVMNSFAISVCSLKAHDIADYVELWGSSASWPSVSKVASTSGATRLSSTATSCSRADERTSSPPAPTRRRGGTR